MNIDNILVVEVLEVNHKPDLLNDKCTLFAILFSSMFLNLIVPGSGTLLCSLMTEGEKYTRVYSIAYTHFILFIVSLITLIFGIGIILYPGLLVWAFFYPLYIYWCLS